MGNDDNDFQRGFESALDAVGEAIEGVKWRLKDDDGKIGETTMAVLAVVEGAIQHERERFEDSVETEARIERIRGVPLDDR